MSNNIVNNYASTIITIFADVVKNYERNLEIIKQAEEELNDLSHEIELSSPKDMYKGYLLYKTIRELRIERRRCKEENELLKDMYEYFTSQQGQSFKTKIQQIQEELAEVPELETEDVTPEEVLTPEEEVVLEDVSEEETLSEEMDEVLVPEEELAETEVTGDAGGGLVEVTMTCKKEVVAVSIKPEAVDLDDLEMLEDLIVAAFNDASAQADEETKEVMAPFAGAMGGMGMF